MKNLDKAFDEELARRLRNYSEEPRIQLWQKLAASTEASRRPLATRRTAWILLLGLISIGGLYYFEKTNVRPVEPAVLAGSLSSIVEEGNGIVGSEGTITRDAATRTMDNASVQRTGNKLIPAGNDVSMNHEHLPITKELSTETSAGRDEVEFEFDEGLSDDAPLQGNDMKNTAERDVEKVVVAKVFDKAAKRDEGKTVIKEKEKKQNRISIYFTIMPTFGYQRIEANSSDDLFIESVKRISTFSTDRLGVRAELGVEDPLTKRIKVFGGLVYFQRKQTIDYTLREVDSLVVTEGPHGRIKIDTMSSPVNKSFEYELKNLGVQIGVSYELSRKKLLQTIGTGFEFHVALNKLESSPATPELTNNPSVYVFYNLYYRMQYPAEGRLRAVFQPTLNYSFYINQNLNAPFYVKPYGLGINLGFTYNF